MDIEAWRATVRGVTRTRLNTHTHTQPIHTPGDGAAVRRRLSLLEGGEGLAPPVWDDSAHSLACPASLAQ